ncbi:MAG: TrkH family potassium uptake protein [Rhodospirillaceae bacterium]|nr:TrkH family potassium uptake protein [Rhodospirillaceae bacterium]
MMVPMVLDLVIDRADWQGFAASACITLFIGGSLLLTCWRWPIELSGRQAFILTTFSWVSVAFFASLPFHFSELHFEETDAFFEAMSALTTTGSTIMTSLETAPDGVLLWRSLLQWIGGIGIIGMGIAVLPFLRVGGMQLFRSESSDRSDKVMPRVTDLAVAIALVYVALTLLCFSLLVLSGMGVFDAVNHAMTTLSTGGFSTHDTSIGFYANPAIEWTLTAFMIAGALPFVRYISFLKGNRWALWRDPQIRVFMIFLVGVWVGFAFWLSVMNNVEPLDALRAAAFNTTSVITTTGFASADYTAWGDLAVAVFFVLTLAGGCTGSTSGAIKTFRFQIMWIVLKIQLTKLYSPNRVVPVEYDQKPLGNDVLLSVMGFIFVYGMSILFIAVLLGAFGLDLDTAVSGAATAVGNVGPGLGSTIGPAGNFASLPDAVKWILALGMMLGRLEFFTALVLLTGGFWRD